MSSAIGHASQAVGEPCLHHQPERFSVIAGWCALLILVQWTRPVSPGHTLKVPRSIRSPGPTWAFA
jgi:hypothetical protein